MYYYSQQIINNNRTVNPQQIIDDIKNTKKEKLISICLEIDHNDNMTPIIFIDNNFIGYDPDQNDKYVLPNQAEVVKTFKKYFTNDPKYLYAYYHNNKYYYVTSFKNNDNDFIIKMLETILEPVSNLLEQKKQLIFDE